jgi:hypothetical protein
MYVKSHPDGATIEVKATPRASANALIGERDGRLVVKLTAPPLEGKANRELTKLLGKALGVAPSTIEILKGQSSRDKVVLVHGLTPEAAKERIDNAIG